METSPFEDAIKAYEKYCKENGLVFSQPSEKIIRNRPQICSFGKYERKKMCKYEIATGKIIP